jgi:hypothetical protein
MDAKQINQTFDLVSYVSNVVNLHKKGAYYIGACPVCGGKDRFNIKRTQTGDAWICRKCNPDKYHSVIDFLMQYHRDDFKAALQRAGGEVQAPRRELGTGKPVTPPAPVQVLPSDEWQRDAWKLIDNANNRLIGEPAGAPGVRYLYSRGIGKSSIYASHLGFMVIGNRPAIVIPWLDMGEIVTAIKYRYIDEAARQDKGKRFSMMAGSIPYLYGLRDILAGDKTLLVVEGELNAVSILQTRPRGVSVVSMGSQQIREDAAPILQALAKHYNRIVIWTDDPAKGKQIRERMNRPDAWLLKSPVMDGVKYDASQMLQAGLLVEFIAAELATQCERVTLKPAAAHYLQVIR